MKNSINRPRLLPLLGIVLSFVALFTSCEQQNYEPNFTVAPGGGTVSTYKSYTLSSATGASVYGRVVFYKYNSSVTLVEMGLYNTTKGATYTASIYEGKLAESSTKVLKTLDALSGDTGAFSSNKYYTVNEAGFYDKLTTYNANVKVMSGTTVLANGNIGGNATPVAQSN